MTPARVTDEDPEGADSTVEDDRAPTNRDVGHGDVVRDREVII